MENKEKETFSYAYSAKQQAEIKAIRKKYAAPEETEDKMAQLRRLDAGVTQKASIYSIAVGVVGALLLGIGMSLAMTDIGERLGILGDASMLVGVTVGVAGIILVCLAHPLYNRIVRRERERVAPEIIRLSDELMK